MTRLMLRTLRNPRTTEAVIIRGDKVITVLPEGDPLRYLLQLPVERLYALKEHLGPLLDWRPQVREVLEAIIEHKEGEGR